jgi:hypothetical protein
MDQRILNRELIEALSCSTSTGRISFVDNDGVARVAVENLRQLERSLEKEGQNLDDLIARMHKQCSRVPVTSDPGSDPHFISFETTSGSHVLMTNSPHTDGDVQVLDLRVAAMARAQIHNVRYTSYFVAIEIFRESGGNQSMFQLGLYLVENESRRLAFCEAENVRVTGPEARSVLRRVLIEFARRLAGLQYSPDMVQVRLLAPTRPLYLSSIFHELGGHAVIVPLNDYFEKLRDIFAYLQGANIEERTKFQHNFLPATTGLLYRVQLSRSDLSSLPFGQPRPTEYVVESYRKPPGHRREEELSRKLCSAADGERVFLEECEPYLNALYAEAGLTKRHFELAPFHAQEGPRPVPYVDLRYVTILRTKDDQPLVVTHWRVRHDQNGNPLPRDRYLDRLQFWNRDGDFMCLEEGRDFRAGIEQVKDISKQIIACARRIEASRLQTLAQQLSECGVNLKYEHKT